MESILKKTALLLIAIPQNITPGFIKRHADPERYGIDDFIYNFAQKEVKKTDLVLDAGAGSFRYRSAFIHARYESTDFDDIFDKDSRDKHTFVCSLDNIPKPSNTYDVVVNAQVLEHVEYPQKVVSEMARVLKPGGKLFLTTPQVSQVHGAPYNYFFYTHLGLASLFKNAGLEIVFIKPRGGMFWVLAKIFSIMPRSLFYQHAFSGFKKGIGYKPTFKYKISSFLLIPPYIIFQIIIGYWIPFILFYLDGLDKQKDYTLGYACYCIKK